MKKVKITTEFITLGQFLKYVRIIENGSDTKRFIGSHKIFVNGEEETRRGRKLRTNDKIVVLGESFQIE